jgi:hypothetical protein
MHCREGPPEWGLRYSYLRTCSSLLELFTALLWDWLAKRQHRIPNIPFGVRNLIAPGFSQLEITDQQAAMYELPLLPWQ